MVEGMLTDAAAVSGTMLEMLQELEDDHLIQRALCHDLEAIADALPKAPTRRQLRRITERIERVSSEHHPHTLALLRALSAGDRPDEEALAALAAMHSIDTSHGEDLITALWDYSESDAATRGGALGYMLRCYFDGCRRAMAFTEALLARALARAPVGQFG